jgi:serine-type D-Ala-D-Ala carboxypeptidase (penicillin-binding protein 5/6)
MTQRLAGLAAIILLAGCATQDKSPSVATPRATVPPEIQVAAAPASNPILWPVDAPSILARSAILIDANTGRTLYQKNADMRGPVASTQKLLTALLITERGDLDSLVRIQAADTFVEPTRLAFRAGDVYPRRTLLTAMMVKSENDAAAALARDHSGSISAFAQAMNSRAFELGARSSYFVNPHGLPAGQFSTARDMSRIAFRAYRQPVLRQMMITQHYTFRYSNGRVKTLEATNKLLSRSPIFNGMKTGYTFASGRCLIASASSNGRNLILVQFGSRTSHIFDDAERMLRWGLNQQGIF